MASVPPIRLSTATSIIALERTQKRFSPVALFFRSWLSAAVTTARSKAVILASALAPKAVRLSPLAKSPSKLFALLAKRGPVLGPLRIARVARSRMRPCTPFSNKLPRPTSSMADKISR